MKNSLKKIFLVLAAGLLVGAMLPEKASAIPTIQLFDLGSATLVTVADGGFGDANPLAGVVTYIGAVGPTWLLNVTTGTSKPFAGSATKPEMDLNSVDATSLAGGTLIVRFSDDFFGPNSGSAIAGIGGTTVGTVGYTTWADAANVLFATSISLTGIGPLTGAFSGTDSGALSLGYPYSLTQEAIIRHSAGGLSSFNATLTVPDGGLTIALLGFALVGVEGLRRKFAK
jgi:hypothetical protein